MLYRELFPRVTGFLAVRLSVREDVEDLTSTVFHRFLEHLDEFETARGSVLTWVLTITHHAFVDHVRRARLRSSVDPMDLLHGTRPRDPLDQLIDDERTAALDQAVNGLGNEIRQMIEMRTRMDMSYGEIAEVLAVSEDAVKQRFSRTQRRLRAALRNEGRS